VAANAKRPDVAAAIPRAYLKVIPDCGHFYGFEQPAGTTRAMLEFLSAFRGAAGPARA
jgi:pimeloyl-ACP methyl ester carboxylesterase